MADEASHPKRAYPLDDGPAPKRPRVSHNTVPDIPEVYSNAVRKKLSSASRTGQACDRCKERKMKCDTNPISCGPCRQKKLPCFTTDRVTGKAFERGQSDRIEGELQYLRRQVEVYQRRHGLLDESELPPEDSAAPSPSIHTPRQHNIPPAIFEGEDGDDLYSGPVNGTVVDIFDGEFDIAGFQCPDMKEYNEDLFPKFNNSKTSILNTVYGAQRIDNPQAPTKEQALKYANHYLIFIWPYVPIVHRSSFIKLVNKFYDEPRQNTSPAEQCTIFLVLSIITHQHAVRNPAEAKEKMEESHRWLHYALGFYRNLFHDRSLASMQALTFILILARNLPKPGFSWVLSHTILVRAIDLNYHRSPDKITLPENQNNPLAKELRKRIFWSILGICVTTGTKVGKPAPWHFQHLDCPVPMAIQDTEVSESGFATKSGKCDFWIALHLFKLLPLLTELYNNIISVRQTGSEYIKTVESLDAKIMAWRQAWDKCIAAETANPNLEVQTLHVETWAAEYQIILHHPKLCTAKMTEITEKNMDLCLKSARRLLASFQVLSDRFKGADFTWHSTVAYALGFGATLQSFRTRPEQVNPKAFDAMKNELRGWLRVMSIADLVLRTDNYLYHAFEPRVKKLETDYQNHLVAFEAYQDYQGGPHGNNTYQNIGSPHQQRQQQPASDTHQYTPQTKHEYPHPQQQHQPQSHHPQHQAYMPVPPSLQHQPPLPPTMSQSSTYNGYPPQQGQPYPPYQAPQYPQQVTSVPQSLAALLNQPANQQGQYAPYTTTAPPPPMVHIAENGCWTDMNGNAMMWPNMIMEPDMGYGDSVP